MHDFTLHIGDLFKDWSKFNNPAWGIGLKLIARYYENEGPLTADREELEYIADVATDDDRRALDLILRRVFVLDAEAGVYRQKRCDKEIIRYRYRCDAAGLSNLKKEAKRNPQGWPANIQQLTLEQFLAHRSVYQCPDTQRLRYLPPGSVSAPLRSASTPPGSVSEDGASVSAPFDGQKPPFSGDQPPSLPASQPPSLPTDSPQVPKGTGVSSSVSESNGADGDQEPLGELLGETIPARSDQPAKPKKKKGGAAREGSVEMPESWSDARRGIVGAWLGHRLSLGKLITPDQFAALIVSTEALSDGQLQACVDEAICKRGELQPHKFADASRDLFRAGSWCEEIYDAYPRKEKKPQALRAIEKAIRVANIAPQELLKRTQTYAVAVAKWGQSRYTTDGRDTVPHPATWFNAHQFNDDPSNWERKPIGSGSAEKKEGGGARFERIEQPQNTVGRVAQPPPCAAWRALAFDRLGLSVPDEMEWSDLPQSKRVQVTQAYQNLTTDERASYE